jgi:methylamine--corrinoid protein Co-methyltransferase
MISTLEVQQRSQNGPIMEEKKFEKKMMLRLRELAKDYAIGSTPEEVIPPLEAGDAIFEASIELARDIGLYHLDTHRIIEFTEEELRYTAKTRRHELILGEGKDQITVRARAIGDEEPPARIIGPAGVAVTEDLFIPLHLSYAKLPEAQGVTPGVLIGARGFNNEAGTPGELISVMTEAKMMREVARQAGKPGMIIGEAPMAALSSFASIASYNPDGYDKNFCMMPLQVYPGLKISWHQLILSAYMKETGIEPWPTAFIILGAHSRDAVETAILSTAGILMLLSITHANFVYSGTISATPVWNFRAQMQTETLKNLAMTRNMGVPVAAIAGGTAGACTKMTLYENFISAFAPSVAGCAAVTFGVAAKGTLINGTTGMEGKIACEAGFASTGVQREEANEIINNVLALFEDQSADPPAGKMFPECYDVIKVEPTDEYKEIYDEAKKDLREAGVTFKY